MQDGGVHRVDDVLVLERAGDEAHLVEDEAVVALEAASEPADLGGGEARVGEGGGLGGVAAYIAAVVPDEVPDEAERYGGEDYEDDGDGYYSLFQVFPPLLADIISGGN